MPTESIEIPEVQAVTSPDLLSSPEHQSPERKKFEAVRTKLHNLKEAITAFLQKLRGKGVSIEQEEIALNIAGNELDELTITTDTKLTESEKPPETLAETIPSSEEPLPQNQETGETPEIDSEAILQKLKASVITPNKSGKYQELQMIFQKMKWNWDQARTRNPHSKDTTEPVRLQGQIEGWMRGELGERLSLMFGLQECQTVFSTDPDSTTLTLQSFDQHSKSHSKETILADAVKTSLKEEPISQDALRTVVVQSLEKIYGRTPTENEIEEEMKNLRGLDDEIVTGYSAAGPETHAGILYGESVIPDGILIQPHAELPKGEPVGMLEIKTYRPREFELFLDALQHQINNQASNKFQEPYVKVQVNEHSSFHLGMKLSEEVQFIDHLRRVGLGLQEIGKDMPIVFRFPQDISDESLQEFGRLITHEPFNYSSITIQKLPLTSAQISSLSRDIVIKGLNELEAGKLKMKTDKRTGEVRAFTREEMRALTNYSNTTPEA